MDTTGGNEELVAMKPTTWETAMMRATPESPRMFDSDFADFFSRTPWFTVLIIWAR